MPHDPASFSPRRAPISKLPVEVLGEIFKCYAESYPEVLNERIVDLCLVSQYWKTIAEATPQLWTRINLFSPLSDSKITVAMNRIRASKLQGIDVSIKLKNTNWSGQKSDHIEYGTVITQIRKVRTALEGTEKRWRSVKVVSDTWVHLFTLLETWKRFKDLPFLEYASMERLDTIPSRRETPPTVHLMSLFGQGALVPKLRELELSAVRLQWDTSVGFQNLRKLQMDRATNDVKPTFQQFATMLSTSPRLEHLNILGFYPEDPTEVDLPIPVVHLPELKDFAFGWGDANLSPKFLEMFQIGNSLERLTLVDYGSILDLREVPGTRVWVQNSNRVFQVLSVLSDSAPADGETLPPHPFISMRGVKKLSIARTQVGVIEMVLLLGGMTNLENIELTIVDKDIIRAVEMVAEERWREGPPFTCWVFRGYTQQLF